MHIHTHTHTHSLAHPLHKSFCSFSSYTLLQREMNVYCEWFKGKKKHVHFARTGTWKNAYHLYKVGFDAPWFYYCYCLFIVTCHIHQYKISLLLLFLYFRSTCHHLLIHMNLHQKFKSKYWKTRKFELFLCLRDQKLLHNLFISEVLTE